MGISGAGAGVGSRCGPVHTFYHTSLAFGFGTRTAGPSSGESLCCSCRVSDFDAEFEGSEGKFVAACGDSGE